MERINSKISCRKTFEVATFQAINYIIKYLLGKLAVKIWTAGIFCTYAVLVYILVAIRTAINDYFARKSHKRRVYCTTF